LRASGPILMFCAAELIFDGTEGVGSFFMCLRSWTHFRRYQGRRVLLSSFAFPNRFLAVLSYLIFMFCVPGHVFDYTEVVGLVFIFCALGLVFNGTKGVGSHFNVLRC
jgi:hypothetical protein